MRLWTRDLGHRLIPGTNRVDEIVYTFARLNVATVTCRMRRRRPRGRGDVPTRLPVPWHRFRLVERSRSSEPERR